MRKRTSLAARLKKLEQLAQLRQPLKRRVIFEVMEKSGSQIVAYTGTNGVTVLRLGRDEPLEAFQARAFSTTGAQVLSAVYAAHGAASERDYEAGPDFAPSQA